MGKNAYRWVRQQFDVEKKTEEYVTLYHKLIPGKLK
jgi:hypothetical protein